LRLDCTFCRRRFIGRFAQSESFHIVFSRHIGGFALKKALLGMAERREALQAQLAGARKAAKTDPETALGASDTLAALTGGNKPGSPPSSASRSPSPC
jgi:hypothetical protein